jgi:hypothetical protein
MFPATMPLLYASIFAPCIVLLAMLALPSVAGRQYGREGVMEAAS